MLYHLSKKTLLQSRGEALLLEVGSEQELCPAAKIIDEKTQGQLRKSLLLLGKTLSPGSTYILPAPAASGFSLFCILVRDLKSSGEKAYQQLNKGVQSLLKALSSYAVSSLHCALWEGADTIVDYVELFDHALYRLEVFKKDGGKSRLPSLEEIFFCPPPELSPAAAALLLTQGRAIAQAVRLTRHLANTPPNICTPSALASCAQKLAALYPTLQVRILDKKAIVREKMGAFLSVAQGSEQAPVFIVARYTPASSAKARSEAPIIFVGKGITFDTGGNSLKSSANMVGMKFDMCGAATVLGVLQAAAALALPFPIMGLIPCCENSISGHASRPDDIVQTRSGLFVENLNTDAEGRLILCDALDYAKQFKPRAVIDIATLTGACVVALGQHASGLMGNNTALMQALLKAGEAAHDRAWPLPLWEEYEDQLKSTLADCTNVGGSEAGSITAACFLSKFTKDYPWAHLDVAGTAAFSTGARRGATGRPVPLLMHYLLSLSHE